MRAFVPTMWNGFDEKEKQKLRNFARKKGISIEIATQINNPIARYECRYAWQIVGAPLKLMRCSGWLVVFDTQLIYCWCFFVYVCVFEFCWRIYRIGWEWKKLRFCTYLTCDFKVEIEHMPEPGAHSTAIFSIYFSLFHRNYISLRMHISNRFDFIREMHVQFTEYVIFIYVQIWLADSFYHTVTDAFLNLINSINNWKYIDE